MTLDKSKARLDSSEYLTGSVAERFRILLRSGHFSIVALSGAALVIAYLAFVMVAASNCRNLNPRETKISSLAQAASDQLGEADNYVLKLKSQNATIDPTLQKVWQLVTSSRSVVRNIQGQLNGCHWEDALSQFNLIASAYADSPTDNRVLGIQGKQWVLGVMLLALTAAFIVSICAIFKTTNPDVLRFAFDTVKTLLGFFIGVATTLIGST